MSEPRDPLNALNSSFTGTPALGDGVALTSTAHPIDVSEAMIAAARSAIKGWPIDATDEILATIYCAMVRASPREDMDIDPDSLETIEIEIPDSRIAALEAALQSIQRIGPLGVDTYAECYRRIQSIAINALNFPMTPKPLVKAESKSQQRRFEASGIPHQPYSEAETKGEPGG